MEKRSERERLQDLAYRIAKEVDVLPDEEQEILKPLVDELAIVVNRPNLRVA